MNRFHAVLLAALLSIACPLAAQTVDETFANRAEALKAMTARDPQKRAEAIAWIAEHGVPSDDAALRLRLKDENPFVRQLCGAGDSGCCGAARATRRSIR